MTTTATLATETAFDALVNLAVQCQSNARPLPEKSMAAAHWAGLGFSLLDSHFLVALDEVDEQLRVPQITRIPGVKNFVTGVANVRGRLMTVIDLAHFFGGLSRRPRAQRRILVVDAGDRYFGLMVDESLGMQHFPSEAFEEIADDGVAREFVPYIRGSYQASGTVWPVMSLRTVCENEQFLKLASSA